MYAVYTMRVLFKQQCSLLQMPCTARIVEITYEEVALSETQQCTDILSLDIACNNTVCLLNAHFNEAVAFLPPPPPSPRPGFRGCTTTARMFPLQPRIIKASEPHNSSLA
jgi:hypothetical protein